MPIDNPLSYLLYLLRLAIGQPSGQHPPLAPDEWRAVYSLSKLHAVVGVAWDGVELLQQFSPEAADTMPADVAGKWFADVQMIEAANSRLMRCAQQLQARLQSDGLPTLLLKGASLAAFYPHPEHRQASDIDLWVPAKDEHSLSDQRQVLISYLKQQPHFAIGEVVYHHIETTYQGQTEVEFHVTPTWLCNPLTNSRLQRLFAQNYDILTPDMQELYCLLHAFRHIYHDGLALRHVLDFYLVSTSNRRRGIPVPDKLYAQLGLQSFAQTVSEVADYVMGKTPADRLSARAMHIVQALSERRVSRCVQWDYPGETLCHLPWRSIHYLWRRMNQY